LVGKRVKDKRINMGDFGLSAQIIETRNRTSED